MNQDKESAPPTANELAEITRLCTADEWSRLCRVQEFIEASGISMEATRTAASRYLGRELQPRPQPPRDF